MRLDGVWRDVCIRNISSRGMLLQAGSPPRRGTYVEVHRGRHVLAARVAWSSDRNFGIQTQDRLDVKSIAAEPDASAANYKAIKAARPDFERRAAQRPTHAELRWRAEKNRLLSRSMEFACVGTVIASVALMVFDAASGALSAPVAVVSASLSASAGVH
jgi:hypothetical protein